MENKVRGIDTTGQRGCTSQSGPACHLRTDGNSACGGCFQQAAMAQFGQVYVREKTEST